MYSRVLFGGQVSLLIALTVNICSLIIGTLVGVLGGYFGGWLDLGFFLGRVVLVEAVFSWNGLGKLALSAIGNVDTPLIMGTVLVAAALWCLPIFL